MAGLDVYADPIAEQRRDLPCRIDVQADDLHALGTRAVIALRRVRPARRYAQRLNAVFTVESAKVFLDTANIATFPAHRLSKRVTDLSAHRFDIDNALDFLFQGI